MSEEEKQIDPRKCIWKPPIKNKIEGEVKLLSFPCRYPEKEKTADVCTPCLLGDVFAIQFSQMQGMKKQSSMNEEIMTFLRQFTSDGSLDDLK